MRNVNLLTKGDIVSKQHATMFEIVKYYKELSRDLIVIKFVKHLKHKLLVS